MQILVLRLHQGTLPAPFVVAIDYSSPSRCLLMPSLPIDVLIAPTPPMLLLRSSFHQGSCPCMRAAQQWISQRILICGGTASAYDLFYVEDLGCNSAPSRSASTVAGTCSLYFGAVVDCLPPVLPLYLPFPHLLHQITHPTH